jgi:Holliday junction resolvasome RuvABC endonuclease subunit
MRVLGIDPGTLRMGIAVLEAQGSRYELVTVESIELSGALPLPSRLKQVYESVLDFIERYQPDGAEAFGRL